jgi:hypothetical protein
VLELAMTVAMEKEEEGILPPHLATVLILHSIARCG